MSAICTVQVILLHLISQTVKLEGHKLRGLSLRVIFYFAPFFTSSPQNSLCINVI